MHETRLEELETKIAFLEQAAADLSTVLFKRDRDLENLRMRVKQLEDQLAQLHPEMPEGRVDEERPPHY